MQVARGVAVALVVVALAWYVGIRAGGFTLFKGDEGGRAFANLAIVPLGLALVVWLAYGRRG